MHRMLSGACNPMVCPIPHLQDRKNREGENKRRREEAERMLREYEEQKAFAEKDSYSWLRLHFGQF